MLEQHQDKGQEEESSGPKAYVEIFGDSLEEVIPHVKNFKHAGHSCQPDQSVHLSNLRKPHCALLGAI
jgi:hypothetical protein